MYRLVAKVTDSVEALSYQRNGGRVLFEAGGRRKTVDSLIEGLGDSVGVFFSG